MCTHTCDKKKYKLTNIIFYLIITSKSDIIDMRKQKIMIKILLIVVIKVSYIKIYINYVSYLQFHPCFQYQIS